MFGFNNIKSFSN